MLPSEFAEGKFVVLFIGLAFLCDMSTGTAPIFLPIQNITISGLLSFNPASSYSLLELPSDTGVGFDWSSNSKP